MTAIKVYHHPEALGERLARLGWSARLARVGNGFFWGEAVGV